MSSGLLRLARVGPAIAVLSTRRCVTVTECCEVSSSFILSVYPLLVGPSRTSCFQDSTCRFFPHDPVVGCLLFVAVRPLSASARSSSWTSSSTSYMLDDSNVWIVFVNWTYHCAMVTSRRRLGTFVTLSQSLRRARFVVLTSPIRRWIPEQRLRRGSILLRSRGSASVGVSRRPDFLRTPPGTEVYLSVVLCLLSSTGIQTSFARLSNYVLAPVSLNRTISGPCAVRPLAAVCHCAGDRNRRHKAVTHVFDKVVQQAGLRSEKRESWGASAPPGYGRNPPASRDRFDSPRERRTPWSL